MNETSTMADTVAHYGNSTGDRVKGIAKRKIVGHGEPALSLARLLQKAAGLPDDMKLRSIECRIHVNEAVIFTAEIYGTAEDVAAAVAANEE